MPDLCITLCISHNNSLIRQVLLLSHFIEEEPDALEVKSFLLSMGSRRSETPNEELLEMMSRSQH